ncbi:MAG: nucleotide exchange factor GrpE [Bacteroidota bacterium]
MNKKKGNKEEITEKEITVPVDEVTETDNQAQNTSEQMTGENGNGTKTDEKEETKKKELTPEEKYSELNDKFLRLYSEFDNFRKRTIKERIELIKTASEDTIRTLLPVIDDLERALVSMKNQSDKDSYEGIHLIYLKFKNILSQKGVEEIKTAGEPFNTDFHEAVTTISSEDEEQKGKIVEVIEKGYLLSGKVIRFAKVIVAG